MCPKCILVIKFTQRERDDQMEITQVPPYTYYYNKIQ